MKSTRQRRIRHRSRQHLGNNGFRLLFSLSLIASTPLSSSASTNAIGISCWHRYKSCLAKRPLLTKSTTSSVVMAISDALCQRFEATGARRGRRDGSGKTTATQRNDERDPVGVDDRRHDWRRSSHAAITGFTFSGPISHAWYNILERIVLAASRTGRRIMFDPHHDSDDDRLLRLHRFLPLAGLVLRLFLDAVLFSPVAVAGYFVWRRALEEIGIGKGERRGPARGRSTLRARWRRGILASWSFWPIANVVNFGLVPVELRVLYNNLLSLFWTGYLSHVNNSNDDDATIER